MAIPRIDTPERARLKAACEALSSDVPGFREHDFLRNLFLTVLDYQRDGEKQVARYIAHFDEKVRHKIADFATLSGFLQQHKDLAAGNRAAAQELWGANEWLRLHQLRGLVRFFEAEKVCDQETLEQWCSTHGFVDFQGNVCHLGREIFAWLVVRCGGDDIKMDQWVESFVRRAIGRAPSKEDARQTLLAIARELHLPAPDLDARIWYGESGRGQRADQPVGEERRTADPGDIF